MFRVGFGMDSHRFEDSGSNKPLKLGGVTIPDSVGLRGTSDADVILHAVFNALSQALGRRSIGYYVQPLIEKKGMTSSEEYLMIPLEWLRNEGYIIYNLGITLECQVPQIERFSDAIRQSVAKLVDIDFSQVGINATSGEGLTSFGRGEGIQAFVVVLIAQT